MFKKTLPAILFIVVLATSGCSSLPFKDLQAREQVDKLTKQLSEMTQTIEQYRKDLIEIETTYANARKYYNDLALAAGYSDPAELVKFLNDSKRVSEETLREYEKSLARIEQKGNEVYSVISASVIGYDERAKKAMNELDTTVNAARNSLSISILGLQEQINTNQKTMDTRAYGFESKMGDDIRTFRNSMDLQMTGLKKLVDDQRVELNKIQSAISTLGQTLEQSGQSIIRSSRP